MLQAPSHFSRVCGHGHIKKFWLMQTQKESQAFESKSNVSFPSSSSRPANRGFVKAVENPPRNSTSPLAHKSGDAAGTTSKHAAFTFAPSKHASFTCAESLSLSPQFCKASPTLSSASGISGAKHEKERFNARDDCLDSFAMAVNAHPSTPLFCHQPFDATDHISHGSTLPPADADCVEPSSVQMNGSNKEHSSSFTQDSPDSHSSHFSRGIQGISAYCPLKIGSNQAVKVEDRPSPLSSSGDLNPLSSHARFPTPVSIDDTAKKGKSGGPLVSRMQEIGHDRLTQAAYIQHPVLKACSLCGTTKTPMWRSGPQGPKSLCNACGIRFKKYRSFPAQEAPELMSPPLLGSVAQKPLPRPLKRKQNSALPSSDSPRCQKVCDKPSIPEFAPHQQPKRSRWHQLASERDHSELKDLSRDRSSPWFTRAGPPSLKKIYGCSPFQQKFKKYIPMEDHLSVSGVFAKDEEEAAVLLMHLSCGLVY